MQITLSAERMKHYLPPYWQDYPEMMRLLEAYSFEIDALDQTREQILDDAFIMTMGESRIEEWEKWLDLPPNGTLQDRRLAVLGYFAVISKMTRDSIKTLVATLYNNARAVVTFEDSTIKVEIKPLPENYKEDTDVTKLYNQLKERKPCHIALFAERYICTWGEVNRGFTSWQELDAKNADWHEVKLFILE